MLNKKHLVGIAVSMALFGVSGLMVGGMTAVYAGLSYNAPIDGIATGPTPVALSELTTPFGFTPTVFGLAPDAALVLPGIPVAVTVFGVALSLSGLTVAEVFGGGGSVLGFLVGLYYAVDIVLEQRQEEADTSVPPEE